VKGNNKTNLHSNKNKANNNSIKLLLYLRAYSTAESPIIKYALAKEETHSQKQKAKCKTR
jgi:hypothetical protein